MSKKAFDGQTEEDGMKGLRKRWAYNLKDDLRKIRIRKWRRLVKHRRQSSTLVKETKRSKPEFIFLLLKKEINRS